MLSDLDKMSRVLCVFVLFFKFDCRRREKPLSSSVPAKDRKLTRKQPLRHLPPISLLAFSFLFHPGCAGLSAARSRQTGNSPLNEYRFTALRMGTEFRILVYANEVLAAQKASLAAFDRIEELENILSDYREGSEVMHLCRSAVESPQVVTPELFFVLENALRMSRLSNGAFDVTIGPVVQLWREARKKNQLPSSAEIEKARQFVGYTNIVLNPDARTVSLKRAGMKIDFGGIGKGYAADQALEILRSSGFDMALVQAGGEVVVGGPPPGKSGWKITIRKFDPADTDAPRDLILHHRGVSTSGDAFQYLEVNGQRYSHIIDPANGMGLRNAPEVTIVAPDGITADALSTTLDILPVSEGMKLVESIQGASAVITRRSPNGVQHFYSKGFPKSAGGATKIIETPRTQRSLRQ